MIETSPQTTRTTPRLGLFWFVTQSGQNSSFVSLSKPWDEVPEIGGFKTVDEGHVDVWPAIQRQHSFLSAYEYEAFPRGRVNWLAEDDTWLLLLDPKLNGPPFIRLIVETWALPMDRLKVMTDPHYRSSERVGSPMKEQ